MKYNFDEIIDRTLNHERKWDFDYINNSFHIKGKDTINCSIADLDFASPNPVINAIISRAQKGVYSYTYITDEFYKTIKEWYLTQHQVNLENSYIKLVHGTVNALHQLVQCFSQENDSILIQTPVYGPFARAIVNNKRNVVANKLIWSKNNVYEIDFDNFEKVIKDNKVKIFILCNPHNPGGIVWTYDQLLKIVNICQKYNVFIISDEVHSDLLLNNNKFISLLNFQDQYNNFVVANSPNKLFNLGGLKSSYLITNNKEIITKINHQYEKNSITSPNVFTIPALVAAYSQEESIMWKKQLLDYVYENFLYLKQELNHIPGLKIMELSTSFLVWINYRETKVSYEKFNELLIKHKLIVSKDNEFAGDSSNCFRINIGTSKKMVSKIINILKLIFE